MESIKINIDNALNIINNKKLNLVMQEAEAALITLEKGNGLGNDFLGWLNLPNSVDFKGIYNDISKLKSKVETVVVVGIGGSYLGARAVISALSNSFVPTKPEIVFAGNSLDENYHNDLFNYLQDKNFGIVVISKSGTTTEPAIAFRILKKMVESKFGIDEARDRIIAITDKARGALRKLTNKEGYKSFVIADDLGGRFSVLSPVGLVPIALAGFDIEKILQGAKEMNDFTRSDRLIEENIVIKYAAIRNLLYQTGKKIEIMTAYSPKLFFLVEWWKQLYGESEGKGGKGIFPAGVINTTDLHSLGQYIQDGERMIFETVLDISTEAARVEIPVVEEDLDNLNYLASKNMYFVNQMAKQGTLLAHVDGGVPNIELTMSKLDEYNIGALLFFFEKACAVSGYILGVNPFDQPGVEAYKSKMFELLGKPK